MIMSRNFSVWSLLPILALAACATAPDGRVGSAEGPVEGAGSLPKDEIAEVIAAIPQADAPALRAITREEFLDMPPGNLEVLLGDPALVRREGVGEFRRYDTHDCRIYAVIFPDAGGRPLIKSLSVGSVVASAPAPVFASCFVTGG